MQGKAKVRKVMNEFKAGKLKSSSGQKVTNPKQAIAIGLSEAGMSKPKKESGMKYSKGGMAASKMGKVVSGGIKPHGEHTIQKKGHTRAKQVTMAGGKGMKSGGMTKAKGMKYGGKC